MTDKFCIDCAHFDRLGSLRARGRVVTGPDPVTGEMRLIYKTIIYAANERRSWWPWRCGPKGRFFSAEARKVDGTSGKVAGGPIGVCSHRHPY